MSNEQTDPTPALPDETPDRRQPYHRLHLVLAEMIAAAEPGQKLPAEPDFAKQLGVSRATLREAMRSFEGQGLIRRKQGVGTFVVAPAPAFESGLEVLESIETLAQKIGLDVTMGEMQIVEISAGALEAKMLAVEEGAPLVSVSRVIEAEGRPVAYLIDTLPVDVLTSQELVEGFTGSVLDMLLKRGDLALLRSVAEVRPIAASIETSRALQIQRGDVLLMFVAQLYTAQERVVDYSISYFLPGYFHFRLVRRVGK